MTSASAGSSRSVGMKYCDQRMVCQMNSIGDDGSGFAGDGDQREAAGRADQSLQLEQWDEPVGQTRLPRGQVVAFEQSPVDEPGQRREEAEKLHLAQLEAG